jgi:hypothetical protein
VYTGRGEQSRGVRNGEKEYAQHLEVIEWCYGLRTGPLEKKEEVEDGRQGQAPDDPYVSHSSVVWTSGFKQASPLGGHDGGFDER